MKLFILLVSMISSVSGLCSVAFVQKARYDRSDMEECVFVRSAQHYFPALMERAEKRSGLSDGRFFCSSKG